MSQRVFRAIALFLIMAFSISVPRARADEWNQRTELTFIEPVEIPGHALPAGTYWFVLANNNSSRDIVRIFNADGSVLCATLVTVPIERPQASHGTILTYAERPHSEPRAVLDWFYPGETVGHEFVYPRRVERELSRDMHQDVTVAAGE
ncbi:MAG: hypothetical protein WA232_05650 [Candidatus Sulfotelmatobacter sp.]